MTEAPDLTRQSDVTSFAAFGREMWNYLTTKGAKIDYTFVDMEIEVPRETGPQSPRATWKLNGTLRISTTDKDASGSAHDNGA